MGLKTLDIAADDRREIKTADEFLKWLQLILDLVDDVGFGSTGRPDRMIQVGNPPFDDIRKCPALGLGTGGEIPHQFRVEVPGLPAGAVEPTLERDVGLGHDELSLERHGSGQIEKKTLSRAVPPDDKSYARAPLLDPLKIVQNGGDLVEPSNLKVTKPHAGNNSGPQGLQDCIALSWLYGNTHI